MDEEYVYVTLDITYTPVLTIKGSCRIAKQQWIEMMQILSMDDELMSAISISDNQPDNFTHDPIILTVLQKSVENRYQLMASERKYVNYIFSTIM
jgi:hypothetical protein